MHSRLHVAAVALMAGALAGCVQATRHSNVMVFGTNTSFGIRAGTSAASVPEIQVGYSRQEAVVMPLLANTRYSAGTGGSDLLQPCDPTIPLEMHEGQPAIHPCSFVSIKGGNLDSYSVLASFGAKFDAHATNPSASGGLAQYFATGMAAQILADRGGAALVSTNEQATATETVANGTDKLFPDKTPFVVGSGKAFDDKMAELRKDINDASDKAERNRKMQAFLKKLEPQLSPGTVQRVLTKCDKSAEDCVKAVDDDESPLLRSNNFAQAVDAWKDY